MVVQRPPFALEPCAVALALLRWLANFLKRFGMNATQCIQFRQGFPTSRFNLKFFNLFEGSQIPVSASNLLIIKSCFNSPGRWSAPFFARMT